MGFSGITKRQGQDFNYFKRTSVNWSSFGGGSSDGYGPDQVLTFSNYGIIFLAEGSGSDKTVEISFNGTTVHAEVTIGALNQMLTFNNRVVSLIWFRLKSGTTGPINVTVTAW